MFVVKPVAALPVTLWLLLKAQPVGSVVSASAKMATTMNEIASTFCFLFKCISFLTVSIAVERGRRAQAHSTVDAISDSPNMNY